MDRSELAALKKCRLQLLTDLDVEHVKDHLIQYDVSLLCLTGCNGLSTCCNLALFQENRISAMIYATHVACHSGTEPLEQIFIIFYMSERKRDTGQN